MKYLPSCGIICYTVTKSRDQASDKVSFSYRKSPYKSPVNSCVENGGNQSKFVPTFCMVQAHATPAWRAILRGKYNPTNCSEITQLCNGCSLYERKHILAWSNPTSKTAKGVKPPRMTAQNHKFFKQVQENFNWDEIVGKCTTSFQTPELEFPKGRWFGEGETPEECALREFEEETGISRSLIAKDYRFKPIPAKIIGSNGKEYFYLYYVYQLKGAIQELPPFVKNSEIQKRLWVNKALFDKEAIRLSTQASILNVWSTIEKEGGILRDSPVFFRKKAKLTERKTDVFGSLCSPTEHKSLDTKFPSTIEKTAKPRKFKTPAEKRFRYLKSPKIS